MGKVSRWMGKWGEVDGCSAVLAAEGETNRG